jgi:hypothetical protein
MALYVYLAFLASLPVAAQALWGARGGVAATIASLALAAAIFLLLYNASMEPPPADWNPEAKAERGMGNGLVLLLFGLFPGMAVLAGAMLAAILASLRFAFSRWKRS